MLGTLEKSEEVKRELRDEEKNTHLYIQIPIQGVWFLAHELSDFVMSMHEYCTSIRDSLAIPKRPATE